VKCYKRFVVAFTVPEKGGIKRNERPSYKNEHDNSS